MSDLYRLQSEGMSAFSCQIRSDSFFLELNYQRKTDYFNVMIDNGLVDGLKEILQTSNDTKTLVLFVSLSVLSLLIHYSVMCRQLHSLLQMQLLII